jgi:hypothetical protein
MRNYLAAAALLLCVGSGTAQAIGHRPEPPYLARWKGPVLLDPPCQFFAIEDRFGWWSRFRLAGYPSPWVGPYRTKTWAVTRMRRTVGRICEMPTQP